MKNQKRLYAWLLCMGLVLALFVSSAYIGHEADHDCTGEDCAICETIALAETLLRSLALFGAALLLLTAALPGKKCHGFAEGVCDPAPRTLVSWKVRLND